MKFAMLAAAAILVASFFVLEAPAQEVIKSSGTIVTTSDYRVAQPARTGLFSRLRNRNNNMSSASMTTTAPATIVPAGATTTTPLTKSTTTPLTQSTTAPLTKSTTTPLTQSTIAPMTTTTSSEPITAQAEPRQGLFGRLRSRLAR